MEEGIRGAKAPDDGIVRVSPSQIKAFQGVKGEGCQRQWGWDKLAGIPRRSTPQSELGTEIHSHLEPWFKSCEVPKGDTLAAQIARHALARWPHPTSMSGIQYLNSPDVELHLFYPVDSTLVLHGFMDLGYYLEAPFRYVVGDHKNTGNLVWRLTEDDLAHDEQGIIYGASVLRSMSEVDEIELRWGYNLTTDKKRKSEDTVVVLPREVVFERLQDDILPIASLIRDIRLNPPQDVRDLPANYHACDRFGGCAYRELCGITPRERLRSLMAQEKSMKEKMEERRKARLESEAAEAETAKPEPAKPEPAKPEPAKAKAVEKEPEAVNAPEGPADPQNSKPLETKKQPASKPVASAPKPVPSPSPGTPGLENVSVSEPTGGSELIAAGLFAVILQAATEGFIKTHPTASGVDLGRFLRNVQKGFEG